MKRIKIFLVIIFAIAVTGCKEIYKPTIISSSTSYLVVEGVLNAGTGPTTIRLTRTFKLDDTARLRGENNARVIVEGKDNTTRELTTSGDGFYTSPVLNLLVNEEYRLKITTADGKEYLSDYVAAKKTPVIDSLGFRQDDKGVQVYVNTHDDSNNTWYYRWEYDETWEIRTYYNTNFKYVNGQVVARDPQDKVSICWKYDHSSAILVGSTASLQADIIFRAPLVFIPNGNEKLAVRYSILLRQYALDKQGYEFYEMMKKNTEGLGTIFDAQPSEIRGNIKCISDPGELVIGYISAPVIEEKRFFIERSQLQNWKFVQDCPEIRVKNDPDSIRLAYIGGGSIYDDYFDMGVVTHYLFSPIRCVECTARGGSVIRPSYW